MDKFQKKNHQAEQKKPGTNKPDTHGIDIILFIWCCRTGQSNLQRQKAEQLTAAVCDVCDDESMLYLDCDGGHMGKCILKISAYCCK